MEPHEYASIFPMLQDTELQQLADDIKLNGLNNPIIKLDGKILDGRNRYAACKIAGIRPSFEEYHGDDPLAFVFSQNFTRRQLSESQKGMIGARYAKLAPHSNQHKVVVSGDTTTHESKSRKQAADMVGVGEATVGRARSVLTHGVPELAAAVDAGHVTVSTAAAVAKLPPAEQRAAVEGGTAAIKAAAKTPPSAPAKTKSKARVQIKIDYGEEIAIQAITVLDQLRDDDKSARSALEQVLTYCEERITKLP